MANTVVDRKPLTTRMVQNWNIKSLKGTLPSDVHLGLLRDFDNYASNLYTSGALSQEEVETIENFHLAGVDGPALRWDPALCLEEIPKDFKLPGDRPACKEVWDNAHAGTTPQNKRDLDAMTKNLLADQWYQDACWPRISEDVAKGRSKVCGLFHFIGHEKVPLAIDAVLERVNREVDSTDDPIRLAMNAQQQFVGIHPFNDGNGRLSRWIMDYVTSRSALPPIFIPDMNHDLSTPLDKYVEEGYQGSDEGLGIMEECLTQYESACAAKKQDPSRLEKLKNSACGLLR